MTKHRVKTTYHGIIHWIAQCSDCSWEFSDYLDRSEGIKQARKHVMETGHSVSVEKGIATRYEKSDE